MPFSVLDLMMDRLFRITALFRELLIVTYRRDMAIECDREG
jgi:hypothetical protein